MYTYKKTWVAAGLIAVLVIQVAACGGQYPANPHLAPSPATGDLPIASLDGEGPGQLPIRAALPQQLREFGNNDNPPNGIGRAHPLVWLLGVIGSFVAWAAIDYAIEQIAEVLAGTALEQFEEIEKRFAHLCAKMNLAKANAERALRQGRTPTREDEERALRFCEEVVAELGRINVLLAALLARNDLSAEAAEMIADLSQLVVEEQRDMRQRCEEYRESLGR